jgi:hypothetical protein
VKGLARSGYRYVNLDDCCECPPFVGVELGQKCGGSSL